MNTTLQHQFNHRTIRKFKDIPLNNEQLDHILHAASMTPTYTFLQAASVIGITDKTKQQQIAQICKQPYVAEAGYLFIIVADMNRNARIAEAKCVSLDNIDRTDRFFATFYDATLMTMNMATAAESMDLGYVILGSINNDMKAMIELLELPPYTFPCLGLAVGVPDQEPTLKPRLPKEFFFMENHYQVLENPLKSLEEYDDVVHEYYDLRDTNNRVDTFTNQMAKCMANVPESRYNFLDVLKEQGLLKR